MTFLNRRAALGAMAGGASSLCFGPALAQTKPKIAFILLHTPGEAGWDYEHARGVEMAKAKFGDRAQIDIVAGVPEGGEDIEVMRSLANDGYEMIWATSFGYMKSMVQAAYEFPNVVFEHGTGYIRSRNLSTYSARFYEGRVPLGFLAGSMTKKNRVGYVASFPIPEVIRGINASFLAARAVSPDIEFDVVWLYSWFTPEKEAETTRALIDRGADIIMQHTDSTAPVEVAQEKGVFAFGQASDMTKWGPDICLTSSINNWGPYYTRRVGQFLDGVWESEDIWGGLDAGMISMGKLLDAIPNRVHLQAENLIQRVTNRQQHAFEGPIRRQDGAGWLAPGESASDSDLLTMNYYIDGITSVIPNG